MGTTKSCRVPKTGKRREEIRLCRKFRCRMRDLSTLGVARCVAGSTRCDKVPRTVVPCNRSQVLRFFILEAALPGPLSNGGACWLQCTETLPVDLVFFSSSINTRHNPQKIVVHSKISTKDQR